MYDDKDHILRPESSQFSGKIDIYLGNYAARTIG